MCVCAHGAYTMIVPREALKRDKRVTRCSDHGVSKLRHKANAAPVIKTVTMIKKKMRKERAPSPPSRHQPASHGVIAIADSITAALDLSPRRAEAVQLGAAAGWAACAHAMLQAGNSSNEAEQQQQETPPPPGWVSTAAQR